MLDSIPLISVVIPTHDRLIFLKRAIASVEQQSWRRIELVVVDDASADGTQAYLRSAQPRTFSFKYVVNEKSVGGAKSRNIGIAHSTGEYIAFLDDDDIWSINKILKQYELFISTKNCTAVSCSYLYFSSFGPTKQYDAFVPKGLQQLLCYNQMGGTSLLFTSRAALDRVGFFDETLQSSQDWDLWIRLFQTGVLKTVNEPLANYESHQGKRISTNMRSVYEGRKALYFKYKSQMTKTTRKINIAAILFARMHKELHSNYYIFKRTLFLIRLLGARAGAKYLLWSMIILTKKQK